MVDSIVKKNNKSKAGISKGKGFSKSEFRKRVSQLSAKANKRIQRLEKNGLESSPAYQKLVADGGVPKFSVKGKTFNEVQSELSRVNQFLNAKTSTVRGINANLKEIAKNTGIRYKNMTELRSLTNNFFALSSKVEQYLRSVEDMASAIGYNKIWEVINEYVQTENVDLSGSEERIDELTKIVSDIITNSSVNKSMQDVGDWVFLDTKRI